MYPMTRFAEVDRLFSRHGLGPVSSVQPLPGGRLNYAVRVNTGHVLRWRDSTRSTGSLKREVGVLERLGGKVPAPQVVASGLDDLLGEYIVQRWIPGQNLLRAWLENPDVPTREWWLREWIAAIKGIHTEQFKRPGEWVEGELKEAPSWRTYIERRIRKRLDLLMRVSGMDRDLILAAERYLKRQAPVLDDGPFCLIHRDLHFANALVDGPHLAAILDFELAEVGTPDYELDTIWRFLRYPADFCDPAVAARVTPTRFASVWVRLRRQYPELFCMPRLRERLCLYALDHDLSCLLQAFNARWDRGEAAVEAATRRLGDILQHRYGPE
jgi:aminoglycoside phosphotransferase (APT) family kinase protein